MDILAHALWTLAIFKDHGWKWRAALLGFLADSIVFGPIMVFLLFTGGGIGPGHDMSAPFIQGWASLYNLTHSLVIVALAWLVVRLATRKHPWLLLGWALHILVDIPTHSGDFFPTPFLWPVSGYTVDGFRWAAPWFMALNYSALAVTYLILYREELGSLARRAATKVPRRRARE